MWQREKKKIIYEKNDNSDPDSSWLSCVITMEGRECGREKGEREVNSHA